MQYEGFLGPGANVKVYTKYEKEPLGGLIWWRNVNLVTIATVKGKYPEFAEVKIPNILLVELQDPPGIGVGERVKIKLINPVDTKDEIEGSLVDRSSNTVTINDDNGTVMEVPWNNVKAIESLQP